MQIYNECVTDLLDANNNNLKVQGDQIENLSEFEVDSFSNSMDYVMKGDV